MSRTVGVQGKNRATKKAARVEPTTFDTVGIIFKARRQYDITFELKKPEDRLVIYGEDNPSWYGSDAIQGFFDNSGGGKLISKSHIGNTGSAIDAVVATRTIVDQLAANTLQIDSAYKTNLAYGSYGNSTAVQIIAGDRYATTLASTLASGASKAVVTAIGNIKVGDIVKFVVTGGGGGTVYKKITAINESTSEIEWSGVFDATLSGVATDAVSVIGFQIKTYQRYLNGSVEEVETELGKVWCTLESEVTDYYVENVHAENGYIKATDLASASALDQAYPSSDGSAVYLASGADGTSPSTVAHWKYNHASFDAKKPRIIINPETTDPDYFDELDTYINTRALTDYPIQLPTFAMGLSKSAAELAFRKFQRNTARMMVNVHDWLTKPDQYSTSANAPDRVIPNVGHVAGAWVYTVSQYGIHESPSFSEVPLRGCNGVYNDPQYSDQDRTDLADAGGNTIMYIPGVGVQIQNFRTASTTLAWRYGHSLVMRNYVRESVKESAKPFVNRPNTFSSVKSGESAITLFMVNLFKRGSTGRVKEGETFGQTFDDEGNAQPMSETFEVVANPENNPKDQLIAGNRNYDIGFQIPASTESIWVYVGAII